MPKGPRGEKRPADAIGAAVMVGKIATGEIKEESKEISGRTHSGEAGGKACAENMTKEERSEIAKNAAAVRWE